MEGALLLFLILWLIVIVKTKEKKELEMEQDEESGFDAELLRSDISKLYALSQEMKQVDEMLIDLKVCRPTEAEKYFRVDWMSAAGENHTLDFIADGENITTEKLTDIAQDRREVLNKEIADKICGLYQAIIYANDSIGSYKNGDKNE